MISLETFTELQLWTEHGDGRDLHHQWLYRFPKLCACHSRLPVLEKEFLFICTMKLRFHRRAVYFYYLQFHRNLKGDTSNSIKYFTVCRNKNLSLILKFTSIKVLYFTRNDRFRTVNLASKHFLMISRLDGEWIRRIAVILFIYAFDAENRGQVYRGLRISSRSSSIRVFSELILWRNNQSCFCYKLNSHFSLSITFRSLSSRNFPLHQSYSTHFPTNVGTGHEDNVIFPWLKRLLRLWKRN